MSTTQRITGMLRRHAREWDKQGMPVQAEATRKAALHMEELQAVKDAVVCPWKPMRTAPKDGTAILVLLDGSDIPKAVQWLEDDAPCASGGAGWYMTWDSYLLTANDSPRYWMECPNDPDA